MTSGLGHRMGSVCILLCMALTLLTPSARGAEPVDLIVTARGSESQLQALEYALVQQFAGEPVHLVLWNQPGGAQEITLERVRADLDFRPGGALLKLTAWDESQRNEFVQGADPQLLTRTIAIIISHVLLNMETPKVVPSTVTDPPAEATTDGGEDDSRQASSASRGAGTGEKRDFDGPGKRVPQPTHSQRSKSESEDSGYKLADLEGIDAQNKRPLHPWVSLTGFGMSAILVGPAIISANASVPPTEPPSGVVRTTDETEEVERVKVRTRGQNRLTAALVSTSVVVGTVSIVLATAFTDWSGAKRTSGLSVVTHVGGVGCQFFSDF